MTYEEVYEELAKERDAVTVWWGHQLDDNRLRALKCRQFPFHIWREYTSTRRNKYVFFSRIFDKRMKAILTGVAAIRQGGDGLTVYTTWLDDQQLISPMVLIPHFWKRYTERAHVEKHGMELVKHYFRSNPPGDDSRNQKIVGRSVRWNGEEHLSCCVTDGVMLGQLSDGLFIARTFITYDMCSGLQQQEFEDKRSQILTDREMYEQARRYYKG